MHKIIIVLVSLVSLTLGAQEFNATVSVNAEQTGQPNLQVFKTLERSLTEFVNNTKWTELDYRTEERIDCSFLLTIIDYNNDSFSATLQVIASRPTYGANYKTTILNVNDKQFGFNYLEFQPMNYNPNSFDSNLISVISFYLYTILGIDADTFEKNSGTSYHEEARKIVNTAQGGNNVGWKATDGNQTRFRLNDDMLSGTYDGYREAMYVYHMEGLDIMNKDIKKGKEVIIGSIEFLKKMNNVRPNSYMMRIFFDAKADEITSIFSGGPSVNIAETIQTLNRIAPTYSDKWKEIKF